MISRELLINNHDFIEMLNVININEVSINNMLDYKYLSIESTKDVYFFIEKFKKHNFLDRIVVVTQEDYQQLEEIYYCSNNTLFKTYLLVLMSKYEYSLVDERFYSAVKEICEEIISKHDKATNYSPVRLFDFFFSEACEVISHNQKKDLYTACYDIFRLSPNNKYIQASYNLMIKTSKLKGCFRKSEFIQQSKVFINDLDSINIDSYNHIESIQELVEIILDVSRNEYKKDLKLRYAKFLYNHKEVFQYTIKQIKVQKAIRLLQDINGPKVLLNEYKLALEEANEETLSSITSREIPFSDEIKKVMQKNRKLVFNKYSQMTNLQKFIAITFDLDIISQTMIQTQIDIIRKNSAFYHVMTPEHIGRDGNLITNDHLSDEKKEFLNHAGQQFDLLLQTKFFDQLGAFFNGFKCDSDVQAFLSEILSKNCICETSRKNRLQKIIVAILNSNIDTNLSNLISELEAGLRLFFTSKKLSPIVIKGTKTIKVDLNNILKEDPNNQYRELLSQYLTDDFLFILEYLLILLPDGNIRNDIMHGNMPSEEMNTYKVWYLVFIILKLYVGFHFIYLEE